METIAARARTPAVGEGKTVDKEAEISALGRALVVERRARYTDFRGKRTVFSDFMRRTAEKLCKRYPTDTRWSTIRGLYRQYPNTDVAARIAIVRRTEELLAQQEELQPSYSGDPANKKSRTGSRTNSNSKDDALDSKSTAAANGTASKQAARATTADSASEKITSQARPNQSSKAGSDPKNIATTHPDDTDVKYLKGVGPKMAELLDRVNVHTVGDLLRHYPRQHLDFQTRLRIKEIEPGEDVTIIGNIRSVGAFQSKKGNVSIVNITINDGTGSLTVSKFIGGRSNKYLLDRYKDSFPKGARVLASGRAELDSYSNKLQLRNAEIELIGGDGDEDSDSLHAGRLVPVYPLTEGLSLRYLRGIIHTALEQYGPLLKDYMPTGVMDRYELAPLMEALWGIHFPEDIDSKEEARRRLVFDELFAAQLHLAIRRHRFQSSTEALELPSGTSDLIEKFRANLPFSLTGAQERVFKDIASDLASPRPMHRLVQGDVGSGKTVVAAMSALVAIQNGYQVAVMAPTEILAEQHYRQFQKWMTPLGLRCALLLGKQGVKERRQIQQDLSNGQVHIAVGTHALIQEEVEFLKLGFVIIDEQHRFGVKQRAQLKAKGVNPELLTMTATPIPRTLALSLHGDLDVSEIDELPPGRKPIDTRLISPGKKKDLHGFIRQQILRGRQIYIVFPLIEESETLSAKAATAEFEKLQVEFNDRTVGLMHGKLKPAEKDEVMEKFRKKEFDILVSTTVIEVGVDVPNATVMVIENADRFGLAQLHQLRGRVGRGAEQSYCFLVSDSRSEQTRQRLGIMCQTNDGFVIAEKDLELRGPGEFLGVRQSGMPDLVLADIVKDAATLEQARQAAIEIVKADPEMVHYPELKYLLSRGKKHGGADLIGSG